MGLNNQNLHNLLFRGFLKPWEAYTGAKINWIDLAQADYNPRLQQAIATGTVDFDIVEMGAPFEGDVCGKGLASVMPDWVKQQIEMDDYVGYLKAPVGTWDGKTYRISIDGDCHNFNYRTDYFSDAELAAAWKSEGHKGDWGVPKTWQQVQEVTKFLKGKQVAGQDAYGYLDPIKGWGGFGFYFLGSRATAYAKHPDDKAWLFDADTMKPRINNPAWVRAIQDVIDALPSEPADQLNADPGTTGFQQFLAGTGSMLVLVGRCRLDRQDQRQLGHRRCLRLLDPAGLGRRLQFEDRQVGHAGERPELRAQHGLYRLGRVRDGARRQRFQEAEGGLERGRASRRQGHLAVDAPPIRRASSPIATATSTFRSGSAPATTRPSSSRTWIPKPTPTTTRTRRSSRASPASSSTTAWPRMSSPRSGPAARMRRPERTRSPRPGRRSPTRSGATSRSRSTRPRSASRLRTL